MTAVGVTTKGPTQKGWSLFWFDLRWQMHNEGLFAANNPHFLRFICRKVFIFAEKQSIMYIHETDDWAHFTWDRSLIDPLLAAANKATGYLEGILSSIGFDMKERAAVEAYTHDVVASSEIEGLLLNPDQVRSSIARRMGVQITGEVPYGHYVEGIVQMMFDAVQNYDKPLTNDRLFGWHCALSQTAGTDMKKLAWGNTALMK